MSTTTYVGVWINWSRGAILGATLTLPQEYGGLVAAFLAIYVTFAGGMFWNFLSFILHQINTTKPGSERDGLHHQLQVVLRNNGGAGSALWEFVKLPVYWRGKTQRPFHHVILFALLAAVNMAVFGVAGIFTSEVTKVPGNSTIILGPSCGGYKISSPTKINSELEIYRSKVLADTNAAAAYVRQCYGENTTSLACGVYNRPSLGFTTNPNATCPFASGVCVYNDNSAFSMDTGLIDSHSDLGANARPEHRINYRRVTTCAPIHGKQFATTVNVTGLGPEIYVTAGPTSSTPYTFSYNLATRFDMGYALR